MLVQYLYLFLFISENYLCCKHLFPLAAIISIMSEQSAAVSKPSMEELVASNNEADSVTVPKEITNEILSELCSRLRVIIAKVTEMKASDNNDLKKVIFCFSFYPSVMLKSI